MDGRTLGMLLLVGGASLAAYTLWRRGNTPAESEPETEPAARLAVDFATSRKTLVSTAALSAWPTEG